MNFNLKIIRSKKKPASPPGTLVYTGEKIHEETKISICEYNTTGFSNKTVEPANIADVNKNSKGKILWININGLADVSVIEKIGVNFEIHPLVLEDILSVDQRPKTEEYPGYIYTVLKNFEVSTGEEGFKSQQISIILKDNIVLSFSEYNNNQFLAVLERLEKSKGKIRSKTADYLAYALIDAIVDNYFVMLEKIGDEIERVEETLLKNPSQKTLQTIQAFKRKIIIIRKSAWPLRELISRLEKSDSKLIKTPTRKYIRDIYDHSINIIDTLETYRDIISGLMDLYLTAISNKMNEVMKVLTIIATIFIPLTFIAGIYGMNFEFMPELGVKIAYPVTLFIMFAIGGSMVLYFKKKKWF